MISNHAGQRPSARKTTTVAGKRSSRPLTMIHTPRTVKAYVWNQTLFFCHEKRIHKPVDIRGKLSYKHIPFSHKVYVHERVLGFDEVVKLFLRQVLGPGHILQCPSFLVSNNEPLELRPLSCFLDYVIIVCGQED